MKNNNKSAICQQQCCFIEFLLFFFFFCSGAPANLKAMKDMLCNSSRGEDGIFYKVAGMDVYGLKVTFPFIILVIKHLSPKYQRYLTKTVRKTLRVNKA